MLHHFPPFSLMLNLEFFFSPFLPLLYSFGDINEIEMLHLMESFNSFSKSMVMEEMENFFFGQDLFPTITQYGTFLFNHSRWGCRLPCWDFLSLLKALKRSRPRPMLSKFIPAMPNRASGSSTPFPNL